jgi:hypothetical protein
MKSHGRAMKWVPGRMGRPGTLTVIITGEALATSQRPATALQPWKSVRPTPPAKKVPDFLHLSCFWLLLLFCFDASLVFASEYDRRVTLPATPKKKPLKSSYFNSRGSSTSFVRWSFPISFSK